MLTLRAFIKSLIILALTGLVGAGLLIYAGVYPMGADVQHNRLTYWLLETLREQSIDRAAHDIKIPENLNTADRLLAGGADYNDMCADCHLKPGKQESDLSLGLYPAPPNLTRSNNADPVEQEITESLIRRQFWIIKHGIKASGMPAWGPTHSDERIWNMVAFLQRLPELSAEQYQILSARGALNAEQH